MTGCIDTCPSNAQDSQGGYRFTVRVMLRVNWLVIKSRPSRKAIPKTFSSFVKKKRNHINLTAYLVVYIP